MKYLDKDGLQQYDALIKEFVNNHVPDLAQVANLAVALEDAADPTSTVKIALCTQAEYDALESYQENVIYIITDDTSGVVYTYANETLDGTESVLTSITIQGIKYAIPQGTDVIANPTLDGTEPSLSGLQVGNTRYAVGGGSSKLYQHSIYIYGTKSTQYAVPKYFEGKILLITKSSDALNTEQKLNAYLYANGHTTRSTALCATGFYRNTYNDETANETFIIFGVCSLDGTSSGTTFYGRSVLDSVINNTAGTINPYFEGHTYIDTVSEITI